MGSDISLRKGCNRYSIAHCYLVESKDFDLAPSFLVGNQVGGALNQLIINPSELDSLVGRIMGGTLRIELPDGTSHEFEGVENNSGGLNFSIDPVIAIEESNKGNWNFLWEPTFQTISGKECGEHLFQTKIEIGNEPPIVGGTND